MYSSRPLQRTLLASFFLVLLGGLPSIAQTPSPVSFGGEIRARSELDDRAFVDTASAADVHLLRTRLHADAEPTDGVEVFVEIQDARRLGASNPALARGTMDPTAGRLDVHQAYFEVDSLFGTAVSVQAGRQELVYGNQRLIGSVGWSNVGRTFDAGVLAYDGSRASVDLFAARLGDTSGSHTGSQNLFGLYSRWQITPKQTLDAFAIFDNDTNEMIDGQPIDQNRLYRITPGISLHGTWSPMSYRLEAIYQTGERALPSTDARASIRASLLSGQVTYSPGTEANLKIDAGYTRLSGDETPTDNVAGQFSTLFATNHKFYGFMDYFPAAGAPYGLQDFQLGASIGILNSVHLAAAYHHFRTAELVPPRSRTILGDELDLTCTYQVAAPVTVAIGVSGFRPGDAMPNTGAPNDRAYWGYVTSTVNF